MGDSEVMWALIGTVVTSVIGGIGWLCNKKCRNQECNMNSGCCSFHSDSKLRETIRQEIELAASTGSSSSSDQRGVPV